MKNKIFCSVVILFLLLPAMVSADFFGAFAVIGRTGLSFVNPEAAQAVNTIICVSNPILCAQGKIVSAVTGEIYQEIARQSPEAAMAIATYNQIDGYLQTGASIIQELKVDNEGYVTEGSIEFTQQSQIGNLVGQNIKIEDVTVSNARFTKSSGISAFTLKENGNLIIKERDPNTGKLSKGRNYNNIASGGVIKINENGQVIEADITSNERGSTFSFADKVIEVPPDTRATFKDGKIKVYGNDKTFALSNFGSQKSARIKIIEGNEVTIAGNNVYGRSFEGSDFKVFGLNGGYGRVVFSEERIVQVGENTAATIKGIQHITSDKNLNIYYNENFNPSGHKNENYFTYGTSKIWLGGSGFTSKLRKGNEIFPEYIDNMYDDSFVERDARVEFSPNGGQMEVTKISPQNKPLALDIRAEGKVNIKNGRWVLDSDGKNVYAKIDANPAYALTSDIILNYKADDSAQKIYELDSEGSATFTFSKDEKNKISEELEILKIGKNKKESEYASLFQDTKNKDEVEVIESIDRKINENQEKLRALFKKTKRSEREGNSEILRLEEENNALHIEKERLRNDERYRKFFVLTDEIEDLDLQIKENEEIIKRGKIRSEGFFGQVIKTQDGDASVSYSEYIEGFPVIKNADAKAYYASKSSKERLETPITFKEKADILELPVISRLQTCADTQIKLNADWQMQQMSGGGIDAVKFKLSNGQTLEYRADGSYTMWSTEKGLVEIKDENFGEGYDRWTSNVMAFTSTGSLRETLIPVTDVNDIRPGDVITLHPNANGYGHTMAIKDIIEIPPRSGKLFYRTFAGSDPAIDARIYPTVFPIFSSLLETKDLQIHRFPEVGRETPVMVATAE